MRSTKSWRGPVAVTIVLGAAAGWQTGNATGARAPDHVMPVLESATKRAGTNLFDGFTVPKGALLLGTPTLAPAKTATLAVDGDPVAVFEALSAQARRRGAHGLAPAREACRYDVQFETGPRTRAKHIEIGIDGRVPAWTSKEPGRLAGTPRTYGLLCRSAARFGKGRAVFIDVHRGGLPADMADFSDDLTRPHRFESVARLDTVTWSSTERPPSVSTGFHTLSSKRIVVPPVPRPGSSTRFRSAIPAPGDSMAPDSWYDVKVERGSEMVAPPLGGCHYGFRAIVRLGEDPRTVFRRYERQLWSKAEPDDEDAERYEERRSKAGAATVLTTGVRTLEGEVTAVATLPRSGRAFMTVDACDNGR
ncbi:MAG: hypothetical protein U0V73_15060 [Acidimicrobiia bacterium]